jgi:regulator of chromosome condensation
LGEDFLERTKPALITGVKGKVVAVAAGGMHTICLTTDGVVWSFGCNDEGALGRQIEDDEEGRLRNNNILLKN